MDELKQKMKDYDERIQDSKDTMRRLNDQIEELRAENANIKADESLKKKNIELLHQVEQLKKEIQKNVSKESQL